MHAHGESGAGRHAFSAVPDGRVAGGVVGVPGSQRKAEEGGKEDAVGVAVALQDFPHGGAVQRQLHHQLLIGRRLGAKDIRHNAAFGLRGRAEFLCEPLLGLFEGFAFPLCLLFAGHIGPAHLLCSDLLAVVGGSQILQHDGDAGTVHDDVVEIGVEIGGIGRFEELQPE